ncbi:MAG TPA: thiamine pyrophosphate-dependent enzyme [Dehalococcoidales bacterium]|nr:thiamine pyrophosphate-dependent enzyme [Dehalococcoidales bacterium]
MTTLPVDKKVNEVEQLLRMDRMPHIFCSGCGIGPVIGCFVRAVIKAGIDPDTMAVASGIGCSARAGGYIKVDSFHTTHGRPIAFATGLKVANPKLNVTVFSGDGDLATIGGNHLIHAARRNIDMLCICVNNFNYGMTGGQLGCTTPQSAFTTTSPYGNFEQPANLPYIMAACGASYIARWTSLHLRELENSLYEALNRRGFKFIEAITPCPTVYGRMNKRPNGLDDMLYYQKKSVVRHGGDIKDAAITLDSPIIVGKFVDIQYQTYQESQDDILNKAREKGRI